MRRVGYFIWGYITLTMILVIIKLVFERNETTMTDYHMIYMIIKQVSTLLLLGIKTILTGMLNLVNAVL